MDNLINFMKETYYELHFNYYRYADPLSMQGNHKGVEKFLSLDAAKSLKDNILSALKYSKTEGYYERQKIMTDEQYYFLIKQLGDFNGHLIPGVEIYEVESKIIKKLIV